MPPAEDRNDRERLKAIEMAVGQIEKQFGKGSIMRLGQKDAVTPSPPFPPARSASITRSASAACRAAASSRSSARNRRAKPRSRCRSSPQAQKLGGMAAFVDAEHALDAQYAVKLGVELDNLLVSQPDNGEQALEIVEVLVRSGARRRRRRRLGRGAGAARRNRRRNGRSADGPAGAPDVAGAAQAHRHRLEIEDLPDLHQPAAREDRRDVRQSRKRPPAAAR